MSGDRGGDPMTSQPMWITQVEPIGDGEGPLAGWTVAVKDNIDVAGVPTTAGCPSYAYVPERSAPVVQSLLVAGTVVTGKTNLDQFATGLTGARSPYGTCRSVLDPDRISGGSSSGSAVAVASGQATIALGTDTAGSGRVPAACNGIVGYKPAPGRWPIDGIVPACRSIDCPSVFTRTVATARSVVDVLSPGLARRSVVTPRLGIPSERHLDLLPDATRAAFERTVVGHDTVPVDLDPLFAVGDLLYGGAWVAERYAAVGAFLETSPADGNAVVASIILAARDVPAWSAWNDRYRVDELAREIAEALRTIDALVLPTVADVPLIDDVLADPIGTNTALGRFTTFVNLLGMCAVAIPGAPRADGVPSGVSVIARDGDDHLALDIGDSLQTGRIEVAVVGAHLGGQPLNAQLTTRGARLERRTTTAACYRLHALDTTPPKPGLVRAIAGSAIEVEVWSLPPAGFAAFVDEVPPPLAIGSLELADGSWCNGFVCEPLALDGALDITAYGGWRAYLAAVNRAH